MKVAFGRPDIGPEEIEAVAKVLESGWLTSGPSVRAFESAFAERVGANHAVALNSCTAALHLALIAAEVGNGDEVIVPSMTFAATAEVVYAVGATPIIVDCRFEDLSIDPAAVEAAMSDRTRAIMAMHYGGRPADLDALAAIASARDVVIIEDAAHAFPSFYKGKPIGSTGHAVATCFSFYANKTMTTGEGGMVTTDDSEFADRVRSLSLHGLSRDAWRRWETRASWDYDIAEPGWKYNLTDSAAALGLVQLGRATGFADRRRALGSAYLDLFEGHDQVTPLIGQTDHSSAGHLFVIRLADKAMRDDLMAWLQNHEIGTSVHYRPLHLHSFYRSAIDASDLPVTTAAFDCILSLPNSHAMTDAEESYVLEALSQWLDQ